MANCPQCGAAFTEGHALCASCGASLRPTGQPFPAQPPYDRDPEPKPHKRSRYAVMGVGSFLGMLILFSIPVVNFIVALVWACGGVRNQTRRNYARAMLLLWLISAAVAALAAFLGVNWMGLITSVIESA